MSCPQEFMTAVGLLKHAQFTHNLKLFLENGPYQQGLQQPVDLIGQPNSDNTNSVYGPAEPPSFQPINAYIPLSLPPVEPVQISLPPSEERDALDMTIHSTQIGSSVDNSGAYSTNSEMAAVAQFENQLAMQREAINVEDRMQTVGNEILGQEENQMETFESPHKEEQLRKSDDENVSLISASNGPNQSAENVPPRTENNGAESQDAPVTAGEEDECCTSQKCGVDVIPRTHENLKKCCYAVAPKKRKRHMEIKHVPKYWSSRFGKRRTFSTSSSTSDNRPQRPNSRSTGTLYIDLEPETGLVKTSHTSDSNMNRSTRMTSIGNSKNFDFQVSGMQRENYPSGVATGKRLSHGSVILQPGASFSIPISYTIPTQSVCGSSMPSELNKASTDNTSGDSEAVPVSSSDDCHVDAIVKESSPQPENSAAPTLQASSVTMETTQGTTEDQHCQEYGVDINSLISMALSHAAGVDRGMEVSRVTSEPHATEVSELTHALDLDTRHNRKRRYPTSKPFKCDQCEHAFNQRIHLKKHMSKHTGEYSNITFHMYTCRCCHLLIDFNLIL